MSMRSPWASKASKRWVDGCTGLRHDTVCFTRQFLAKKRMQMQCLFPTGCHVCQRWFRNTGHGICSMHMSKRLHQPPAQKSEGRDVPRNEKQGKSDGPFLLHWQRIRSIGRSSGFRLKCRAEQPNCGSFNFQKNLFMDIEKKKVQCKVTTYFKVAE